MHHSRNNEAQLATIVNGSFKVSVNLEIIDVS